MTFAYCWASGLIEFGRKVPEGAIQISKGTGRKWKERIQVRARLAYDGKSYLVPGIPEGEDNKAKVEALARFAQFVNRAAVESRA